ncbi:MAG: F0F1 ATP synthase subunit A [Clostridia bacterium]|nr:F0F1 ATP synthase subunit A [Clostridia bacterium]
MSILTIILIAVSTVCLVLGLVGFFSTKNKTHNKKGKKKHRLFLALTLFALWLLVGTLISSVYKGKAGLHIEFSLFSDRITLFGMSFAKTTVVMWGIIALVFVMSLIFRIFIFPKFDKTEPKGLQNGIELSVEFMENFAKNSLGDYSDSLAPYMYTLGVFMIFAAISELFGFRPPTSDIVVTFAMGLITFVLINVCGIKKKGVKGRIKSMTTPTPVILPMKILSDVAVPVSLACRLFGNMLGGMIVMDLLKSVLGGYGSGIPAVAGLYFNVFHPLIQAYIFIILSMTFINEAIE